MPGFRPVGSKPVAAVGATPSSTDYTPDYASIIFSGFAAATGGAAWGSGLVVSKQVAYAVLLGAALQLSKQVAYVVMVPPAMHLSKQVAYVAMLPPIMASVRRSKLLFSAF